MGVVELDKDNVFDAVVELAAFLAVRPLALAVIGRLAMGCGRGRVLPLGCARRLAQRDGERRCGRKTDNPSHVRNPPEIRNCG